MADSDWYELLSVICFKWGDAYTFSIFENCCHHILLFDASKIEWERVTTPMWDKLTHYAPHIYERLVIYRMVFI